MSIQLPNQGQVSGWSDFVANGFARQRGHLVEWVPVLLAVGIGIFFALKFEPGVAVFIAIAAFILCAWLALPKMHENWRPLLSALILIAVGFCLAGTRAHLVSEPKLSFRYYGPIEGRITNIDRSASGAVRLTLDKVVLSRMSAAKTPTFVRVSLHGEQPFLAPEPGQTIVVTGHLSSASGPVEPGGYDFQRHAWFTRLGALGYARTPALLLEPANQNGPRIMVARMRANISAFVIEALPGKTGAFASAVTTGDRSSMDQKVLQDLRGSNLAHLLAISGLHMGLLTGFVFASLRYVLALIPGIALKFAVRKIAAATAICVGAFYLTLSGGNVATERAFIMAAVMFGAILINRRALTLRSVAVAATIVLVLNPEALVGPGFQMSFAATTALVATFGVLNAGSWQRVPKWARPVATLVISSAVAGAATAPVAAAHFNRIADYGLIANLLSVPMMGMIVMPGAVLAAVLWPFGLASFGLAIMAPGINWILFIAEFVANLPGAQSFVVAAPPLVLPLFALGMLWAILWQGPWRARIIGFGPVVVALFLWQQVERPTILVSDTAGLVGLMTPDGRALTKAKGDGFSASSWLENDGDGALQPFAAARTGIEGERGEFFVNVGALKLIHITGRGASERLVEHCAADVIIVTTSKVPDGLDCEIWDKRHLRQTVATAITIDGGRYRITTVRDITGDRMWNRVR